MSRIAAVLLILGLAGCGMKGSLERPTGPAPAPLLEKDKTPTPIVPDVSTDTKAQTQ